MPSKSIFGHMSLWSSKQTREGEEERKEREKERERERERKRERERASSFSYPKAFVSVKPSAFPSGPK